MSLMPMELIFDENIPEILVNNFIMPNSTRLEAVRCLLEIANLKVEGEEKENKYRVQLAQMYLSFIK